MPCRQLWSCIYRGPSSNNLDFGATMGYWFIGRLAFVVPPVAVDDVNLQPRQVKRPNVAKASVRFEFMVIAILVCRAEFR
jgi:hypothetical protein